MAAIDIVDAALQSLAPPPENPRPALPENISVVAAGTEVYLTWDFPLPEETPGVQVHRAINGGWMSMTRNAQEAFLDSPTVVGPQQYRVRGYGYRQDGTAHASPWSDTFSVVTEEEGQPPKPEPGGFRALDAVENTVDQNKELRLPDVRATREPRQPVGTIGDVRRNDWNTGDGDLWKGNMESVVPKGYAQWSSNLHKKLEVRPGDYTWQNIGVSPGLGADQLKWGTREFNAPFRSFIACDFTEIPREHGLYVSNNGSTEVVGCTFLRCGSQGVQFAHRPLPYQQYDADNLPYAEPPSHVVSNSHFVDNAYKGDRPSFNLTYFNPGTSENPGALLVEDCTFVCNWPEPKFYNGRELRSTGAMVVGNMQGNQPLVGNPMMERVTLRNNLYDYTRSDRALVSLRSCEDIVIEDCCFILRDSAYPLLSVDKYVDSYETKSKTLKVRNTHAEGGRAQIHLEDGSVQWIDIHCPGEEIVIDTVAGVVISRMPI